MRNSILQSLDELIALMNYLPPQEYSNPCAALSHATIGQHTRHVIELLQCLEHNYHTGCINYDLRARDHAIEQSTEQAIQALMALKDTVGVRPDKTVDLQQSIDGELVSIKSTYTRELLYNLEHCIHHQALIKVALQQCGVQVSDGFGVARSTIDFRNKCAQ